MRVTKSDLKTILQLFKNRFIDFDKQRQDLPNHVINDYISWLHDQWNSGTINLPQYRKLIQIDILTA